MHTAITATRFIGGRKEPVDSTIVHAGQILLGGPQSSLTAYSAPEKATLQEAEDSGAGPSQLPAHTTTPAWTVRLSKNTKTIEQLHVIKEANILVTLIDAQVYLHDLATITETGRGLGASQKASTLATSTLIPEKATTPLIQTKGALSVAVDTSIQKAPILAEDHDGWGAGYRHRAGKSTIGRAYRPSDPTLGKGVGSINSASLRAMERPLNLLGMDDIRRNKEQKQRQSGYRDYDSSAADAEGIMSVVTTLIVGCRRKVIVFRWVDGAFWDTKEIALPHTPRSLAFPSPTIAFMGYSAAEFALLTLPLAAASSVADLLKSNMSAQSAAIPSNSVAGTRVDLYEWKVQPITIPQKSLIIDDDKESSGSTQTGQGQGDASGLPQAASMAAVAGAFTGLGGYIGMSNKTPPKIIQIEGSEVLLCRDNMGVFLNDEGKPTRREGIEWPSIPEEVLYVKPYILSIHPPAYKQTPAYPLLQVRSAGTLLTVQTEPFPQLNVSAKTPPASVGNAPSVRLLTPSQNGKPPMFVTVAPTERGALEKEGLSVWTLQMKSWGRQIDELVRLGEYQEALALLHSVDEVILENKAERKVFIETLYALSLFMADHFDEAIERFIELDTNPARVIAMYPDYIAGPLATKRSKWISLFGGQEHAEEASGANITKILYSSVSPVTKDNSDAGSIHSVRSTTTTDAPKSRSRLVDLWGRRAPALQSDMAGSPSKDSPVKTAMKEEARGREEDTVKTSSTDSQQPQAPKSGPTSEIERKSVDALGRFLADRRRIFKPILETQPTSHSITLSQTRRDPEWLLDLPSAPLNTLNSEQLSAVAQTVDTALFKTFLATKPGLLGPLCRVENWCEVEQVEELLMKRKRFSELISLYGSKEMHEKALQLLRTMSDDVDDIDEKVSPTIRYLQNLGPEHIDVILDASHWVLSLDADLGMDIFCADTGKVATLPRHAIVADLENFSEELCIRFLEHLIDAHGESDPHLHEKLAILLLRRVQLSSISEEDRAIALSRLKTLLETSRQYRAERVLHRVPTQDSAFYDVRALLLGRIGQHEAALRIYIDRLDDHAKAEEYCKAIRASDPTSNVFLTLLQIYLRPKDGGHANQGKGKGEKDLQLAPALAIISRYGGQVDSKAALELLPSQIPLSSVAGFATKTLQHTFTRRNEAHILSRVANERALQVSEQQARLHRRRVKITEGRTCPRCLKRLGNSVIAVTAQGAVLHYGCSRHDA